MNKKILKLISAILVMVMIATAAPLMGFATDSGLSTKITYITNTLGGVKIDVEKLGEGVKYDIYRKTADTDYEKIMTTDAKTTIIDKTAVNLTIYTYDVAVEGGERSGLEKTIKYIQAPTLSVECVDGNVIVHINPVEGVDHYSVKRRDVAASTLYNRLGETEATDAPYFVDTTAKGETKYVYAVSAIHEGDNSYYTTYTFTTPEFSFLSTPVKLTNVDQGVKVAYDKVDGAKSYTVYRREAGSNNWVELTTFKPTSYFYFVDKSAVSGTMYYYSVGVTTADAKARYDSETDTHILYLAAPTVSLSYTDNGVEVRFTESNGAESYQILRKAVNASSYKAIGTVSADSDSLSFIDTTAVVGESYTYAVRVFNNTQFDAKYNSYLKGQNFEYANFSEDANVVTIDFVDVTDDVIAEEAIAEPDTIWLSSTADEEIVDTVKDVVADVTTEAANVELSQVLDFITGILANLGVDTTILENVFNFIAQIVDFVNNTFTFAA